MKSKIFAIIAAIFSIFWTLIFLAIIISCWSDFRIGDWIAIIAIATMPNIGFIAIIHRKSKKSNSPSKKQVSKRNSQKTSQRDPIIKVSTSYIPDDFPKYPNENTDIPANAYIYDTNGNILRRADGQPFNDADAAYLMRYDYSRVMEAQKQSKNPIYHRTEREEELSYQFGSKHGSKSQKICDVFLNLEREAGRATDIDEKIRLTQAAIDAFYKAKEWHYKFSKGAMLHFQDYWECLHNSRRECYSWVEDKEEYLEELINKRDVIVPWILENATNGFTQTQIYKEFPDEIQSELRRIIQELTDNGKVTKTKKGNTYFIELAQQ